MLPDSVRSHLALLAALLAVTALATGAPGARLAADESELGEASAIGDASAAICRRIGDKLASVGFDECMERQLELSGGAAVSGAPILIKEYPALPGQTPRGRILLVGGLHGDEYSSATIVFKWLAILDRFHSGMFHWRVSPLVNPDGLLRQRSQRVNANGVDLDRNLPCPEWHAATGDYWLRRTSSNPRRYPGSDPLSEPESRWLEGEIRDFQPHVVVSVHAPPRVLGFDAPLAATDRFGSLHIDLPAIPFGGTYPGSLARYGVLTGIPVVTVELASARTMPPASEQQRIWLDLVRLLTARLPV